MNHSNICTLRDAGPDYLVMEYIEGTGIKGPPLCEPLRLAQQFKPAWLELKDNRQHARQVYQPAR